MMWIERVLIGGASVAAIGWAVLAMYLLAIQRRRDAARKALASAVTALEPLSGAALADRVDAVRGLLGRASRELLMRAAADPALPAYATEAFVALIDERWTIDTLVADAGGHDSARAKWRRITSLRVLARSGHPHLLPLLERAIDDRDADVAACALTLLGRSRDPHAADLLVAALASPRLSPSRVAVYIDELPQDVSARLIPMLDHSEAPVRQWAATLLARYPDARVEHRLAALTGDADPGVRKAAIQTLGHIGAFEAADCAVALLADPMPYVRAHAVRALGDLGRTDLADRVSSLLGDADWWVRLAARESLEMMGPEVWPVLVRCLDDSDKFVRNGAAEVIQNLGVLDSLIMLEAATDNPTGAKVAMLQRIAAAGGVRFTESLVERAGPVVGPRVRRLLDSMGMQHVGAA